MPLRPKRPNAGRRGGPPSGATPEQRSEWSAKGGNSTARRYGIEFYHALGVKGGTAVLERYGIAHFRRMGILGNNGHGGDKDKKEED